MASLYLVLLGNKVSHGTAASGTGAAAGGGGGGATTTAGGCGGGGPAASSTSLSESETDRDQSCQIRLIFLASKWKSTFEIGLYLVC